MIAGDSKRGGSPDYTSTPSGCESNDSRVRTLVLGNRISVGATLHAPAGVVPRAVVVAVHGAGMTADYFDARSEPSLSLCATATRLGYSVLTIDRPGYGAHAERYPAGLCMDDQATAIGEALEDFVRNHPIGAGLFLLAHSYGGAVALTMASNAGGPSFIGIDVSGIGHEFAVGAAPLDRSHADLAWPMNWGKLSFYPPRTFTFAVGMVAEVPACELDDIAGWPERFSLVAERIGTPVRFTFAEYEQWWIHDDDALDVLRSRFGSCRVSIDVLPQPGHNISLGWTAAAYHLKALAFLEECLGERASNSGLRTA